MQEINPELIQNELWLADEALFAAFDENYVSPAERVFFETLRMKMFTELAPCKELLISENANDDQVYLLRDQYDEFILGQGKESDRKDELHLFGLFAVLSVNMKDAGFLDEDITLLEWLRKEDYGCLMYDHNYAYL